jgi:hypothetical protein
MRLSRLFVPLALLLAATHSFAIDETPSTLKFVFVASPDNTPDINEFNAGKARVRPVIARLEKLGFKSIFPQAEIWIASAPHSHWGRLAAWYDSQSFHVFVSPEAGNDEIADYMLIGLEVRSEHYDFYYSAGRTYDPHAKQKYPKLQQLLKVKQRVEQVIAQFIENDMPLKLPEEFFIEITVGKNGKIEKEYGTNGIRVSISSTTDEIERHFMEHYA